MSDLSKYAEDLTAKAHKTFSSGDIFAKVLTPNDDSGRHGVLIPSDAYAYFPDLSIPDSTVNTTETFPAFDAVAHAPVTLAYKYYQRYPERRITRLNGLLNQEPSEARLIVFLHATYSDGSRGYYVDAAKAGTGGRFRELFTLIFGDKIMPAPGVFVVRPVALAAFKPDSHLTDLLGKFDEVKARGWISTLREGDTGIGYTFETLLGIKENNDQIADFKGIEIKCTSVKEGETSGSGKINLFQAAPTWINEATAKERIRIMGQLGIDGRYKCHSQVSTTPNNLGLLLDVLAAHSRVDLRKHANDLGYWSFQRLKERLVEKHSRAVFVKARIRNTPRRQYSYEQLVYCAEPSIDRFVKLVTHRNIVFELIMSEKADGTIRNHGYPWRLIRAQFLEHLFAFQIKLR